MEYRHLGKSGLKVSEIAFGPGNWSITDNDVALRMIGRARDARVTLFDTANFEVGGKIEEWVDGREQQGAVGRKPQRGGSSPERRGTQGSGRDAEGVAGLHFLTHTSVGREIPFRLWWQRRQTTSGKGFLALRKRGAARKT
jgi:hypothetical protein